MLGRIARKVASLFRRKNIYTVRGFSVQVDNERPDIPTQKVVDRLDAALHLIEEYQPWRLEHLRRDLSRFWITRYPVRGAYFSVNRVCMIELTFLAREDITAAPIAACIIHEGMHARVDRMVRNKFHTRAREERLCRRAELNFAVALPSELGDPVKERAQAALLSADDEVAPDVDWEDAFVNVHKVDTEIA